MAKTSKTSITARCLEDEMSWYEWSTSYDRQINKLLIQKKNIKIKLKGRPNQSDQQRPQTNENLEKSHGNPNLNESTGFTLMHPAFQNKNIEDQQNSIDNNFKTFSDHKLCSNDMLSMQKTELNITKDSGNESEIDANIGSDGSDSEEIDLTSGGCIDYSNNNKNN